MLYCVVCRVCVNIVEQRNRSHDIDGKTIIVIVMMRMFCTVQVQSRKC